VQPLLLFCPWAPTTFSNKKAPASNNMLQEDVRHTKASQSPPEGQQQQGCTSVQEGHPFSSRHACWKYTMTVPRLVQPLLLLALAPATWPQPETYSTERITYSLIYERELSCTQPSAHGQMQR
jgi:hypothetical protein